MLILSAADVRALVPMEEAIRLMGIAFAELSAGRAQSPLRTPLHNDQLGGVTLFMPAMPTMSMPAMRNQMRLPPAGGGVYRGPGQVLMGGRWEATVAVSKDGRQLASRQFPLVAK